MFIELSAEFLKWNRHELGFKIEKTTEQDWINW